MPRKQKRADVSKLIESTDLSFLGFGPTLCERLESLLLTLEEGEIEKESLREKLQLTAGQLDFVLHAALNLGVVSSRKQYFDGAGLKDFRGPDLYCVEAAKLQSLKEKNPVPRDPLSIDSLSPKRQQQLAALVESWEKVGFKSRVTAERAAMVIGAIGTVRSVKPADIMRELPLGESTIKRVMYECRKLGFLVSEVNYDDWPGRGPSTWTVKWRKIPSGSKKYNGPLPLRLKTLRVSRRKRSNNVRLTQQKRQTLRASLLQSQLLHTPEQRANVECLVSFIGTELITKTKDLAVELGISSSGLEKIARLACRAGFIEKTRSRNNGLRGARTKWIVPWPRLESLAGVEKKTACSGKVKMVKKRAVKSRKGGQKPDKRNLTCEWIENWRIDNPESSLEQARRAYIAQFPQDIISLDALKKAIRRRRSNAV